MLIDQMLLDVPSRRVDVFRDGGMYILQTTKHPKIDVSAYLNAFPASAPVDDSELEVDSPINPPRMHVRMQHALIQLGRAEGCAVWVPPHDRALSFEEERFDRKTIDRLPRLGFDENTRRIVQNIDVLWLQGNLIQKAIEIEATTSIYSGLLRLNDLVLAQPNNQVDLVVASSQSRRQRVFEQLSRPSFRQLISQCGFVSFEHIEDATQRLEALDPTGGARVSGLLRADKFELPSHVVYPVDTR
jgi:type II restriction enzyme